VIKGQRALERRSHFARPRTLDTKQPSRPIISSQKRGVFGAVKREPACRAGAEGQTAVTPLSAILLLVVLLSLTRFYFPPAFTHAGKAAVFKPLQARPNLTILKNAKRDPGSTATPHKQEFTAWPLSFIGPAV
jgi:hypothetical protein